MSAIFINSVDIGYGINISNNDSLNIKLDIYRALLLFSTDHTTELFSININNISALDCEIIDFDHQNTSLIGFADPKLRAKLELFNYINQEDHEIKLPLLRISIELNNPICYAHKKSYLIKFYCYLEQTNEIMFIIRDIWKLSNGIDDIYNSSDSFNNLHDDDDDDDDSIQLDHHIKHLIQQYKHSNNHHKISLGIPKWAHYIPQVLYHPLLRRFITFSLMLWTIFSAIWAFWQLYNNFELFHDVLKPIVQYCFSPFEYFFIMIHTFLLHLTSFWIEIFKPIYILFTSFFYFIFTYYLSIKNII